MTTITLTCSPADRVRAARFAARVTRRAGASRRQTLAAAVRMLLRGRADLDMRPADADLYLALHRREVAPERVLSSLRAAAALGATPCG